VDPRLAPLDIAVLEAAARWVDESNVRPKYNKNNDLGIYSARLSQRIPRFQAIKIRHIFRLDVSGCNICCTQALIL
jgi:hypothetical protein